MSNLLVSLPKSVGSIQNWLEGLNKGSIAISYHDYPQFKIGTLDSLIIQIEQLTKLDHQFNQIISKVLDIKSQLSLPIDSNVNSKLSTFKWDSSHFRIDKSINDLITNLENESIQLDNDLKSQFQNYNSIKSNLLSIQKKQDGDLSIKSLHSIVKKDDFIIGSDHLITTLLAIPISQKSQFLNTYETLTNFVVPRSAKEITHDSEFILYGVTLFKKYEQQFISKSRDLKWIPREFKYSDDLINSMKNEFDIVKQNESNLKNDLIRLVNISFNEILSNWFHIKFLKSFVESVLRYGLPPNFYCFNITIPNDSSNKYINKVKLDLINKFKYLQGKDINSNVDQKLNDYANLVDTNYQPFVIYNFDII